MRHGTVWAATDWRHLGERGTAAWFAAPSRTVGARFWRWITDHGGTDGVEARIRAQGVLVRIDATHADAAVANVATTVSRGAEGLGMRPDASRLSEQVWHLDSAAPAAVEPFWRTVLGHRSDTDGVLRDPLRRDPDLRLHVTEQRAVRHRSHVDVSVTATEATLRADAVADLLAPGVRIDPDAGYHPLADRDGNEIDLVPADRLADGRTDVADWWTPFGAMVCYPVPSPATGADLAEVVAALADEAGHPLLIDVGRGRVIIDTGKDQWFDPGFVDLAARIQAAARSAGLTADPSSLRFVQWCIDAVDVPRVRKFWQAVLGYDKDPREGVSDIVDPLGLHPPMIFQTMPFDEAERRHQRNRFRIELVVPDDHLESRTAAALAAGGRFRDGDAGTIVDPEDNEIDLVGGG